MKKLFLFLMILPLVLFSQEKIDTYYNTLAQQSYSISIGKIDKKGNFDFYIEAKSVDSSSKQAIFILSSDKVDNFKNYISHLKDIHKKWSITAQENDVKELIKDIDYKNQIYSAAFSYGDWKMDFNARLKAQFKIIQDKYYIVISSFPLTASDNRYMKSDGFMFSFNNENDFDDLIKKIDVEESKKILLNKASKEDLFKN